MDKKQEQLETLREIRSLMEHSSRFLSLSGLSGVIAGIAAILGTVAAYLFLGMSLDEPGYYRFATEVNGELNAGFFIFLLADSMIVLIVSLLAAGLLSRRKARKHGNPIWDGTAKRLIFNMFIPLVVGGIYCLILFSHGHLALIVPATLIFYGLALLNASKYVFNDIRYLGIFEIVLGLIASVIVDYGLLFWAFGFGILHIVYGISMYFKYER